MLTIEQAIARQAEHKKSMQSILKAPVKSRQIPRQQAIKNGKVDVLNQAINQLRDDMRKYKTEEQRRCHYLAISKLSQIRDEL